MTTTGTTTNNQQPTTNNQQPTTNNQQPTTNNQQPTTNNQQPTTNNKRNTRTTVAGRCCCPGQYLKVGSGPTQEVNSQQCTPGASPHTLDELGQTRSSRCTRSTGIAHRHHGNQYINQYIHQSINQSSKQASNRGRMWNSIRLPWTERPHLLVIASGRASGLRQQR